MDRDLTESPSEPRDAATGTAGTETVLEPNKTGRTWIVPRPREASSSPFRLGARDIARRFAVVSVWIAVIIVFSALRPNTFFTFATVQTIVGSQAVLLMIVIGLLIPLAAGEFDLSVASVTGLSLVLIGTTRRSATFYRSFRETALLPIPKTNTPRR